MLLVDKSAYVRGLAGFEPLAGDELCLCAITRLELLHGARSGADYARLDEDLTSFRDLRMDAQTFQIAATAQRELGRHGRHRVPLPDLLIAGCAQQHAAHVLHVDHHYDGLADVLAFSSVRL